MTTATTPHTAPARAAQDLQCVACGRPYGRRRAPRTDPDSAQTALLDCTELVVCDQCWHLAGNTSGVTARLTHHPAAPALVFDPAVEALLLAAHDYDLLHPLDRFIVESGVRWAVLRHIAVPARMQLAAWIAQRCPPEATRPADSPSAWLDAVEHRIRAQTRPDHTRAAAGTGPAAANPSGTQFVYNAKRRRWWRICHILRCCADRDTRPLTWVTQEEIAAAIGCSTRTVRRCVAWLRAEGLLWEIVPGCRLPQQSAPDGETPTESAQRQQRMAAAIAAEEAAMARARAELTAVRDGHRAPDGPTPYPPHHAPAALTSAAATTTPDGGPEIEPTLVNLAPVYELRVPLPARETPAQEPTPSPTAGPAAALSSTNTDPTLSDHENVRPPQVSNQDHSSSNSVQPVDNRRASRSPDENEGCGLGSPARRSASDPTDTADRPPSAAGDRSSPQSEAVRAAQWLLRSRLDPRICEQVSIRWLAAQIRGAHFLDRHGWTWNDLADQLHGYPEHTHLPYHIRDCRAWIRARIRRATPALPPTKLRIVLDIERGSDLLRRRRRDAREAERRADITSRRTAIDACPLCDEVGWIHVDPSIPTARCNHDPDSGGW